MIELLQNCNNVLQYILLSIQHLFYVIVSPNLTLVLIHVLTSKKENMKLLRKMLFEGNGLLVD